MEDYFVILGELVYNPGSLVFFPVDVAPVDIPVTPEPELKCKSG